MAQVYGVRPGEPLNAEIEVKRSRFLCYVQRVDSEQEARSFIADVRATHPAARHHCTAFRVVDTEMGVRERSSDDGEPAGTAGHPMLAVLRRHQVVNVCAVVVRYFGGVLLGTGGLVRAYSEAVEEALAIARAAGRLAVRRPVELWAVAAPIAEVGRWEADLRGRGVEIVEVSYGENLAPSSAGAVRCPDPLSAVLVAALVDTAEVGCLRDYIAALSAGAREPYLTERTVCE